MAFSFKSELASVLQIEEGELSTEYKEFENGVSTDNVNDESITLSKLSSEVKNAIQYGKKIVEVGQGYKYESLSEAVNSSGDNTVFIVHTGTYNIYTEYIQMYGSDYFKNYVGYADSDNVYDRGLFLKEGCELIGIGNVSINFPYPGSNENVKKYFSVISTSFGNRIKNISLSAREGSCRYLIHDDFATDSGENIIESVVFNGASYLNTAIGGGMGIDNSYIIKDCLFENAGGLIIIRSIKETIEREKRSLSK